MPSSTDLFCTLVRVCLFYVFIAVQVTHSGHTLQVIPNLTAKNSDGHSALGLALVMNSQLDIAELLLNGGADVNDSNSDGRTLLLHAITRRDVDSAIFLLKHQADPNAW